MSDFWVWPKWVIKEELYCKVTHFRRDLHRLLPSINLYRDVINSHETKVRKITPLCGFGRSRNVKIKYNSGSNSCNNGCIVGVDLIINTLAGVKLLTTVDLLADGGQFLELGKFDLQQNTSLGNFPL